MQAALLSTGRDDWCTPQDFFARLDEEFHFALDAAALPETAKCALYYSPEENGLTQSWDVGGAVFVKPPYGRAIGAWVQKAHDESQKGVTVVMLLPARTDTAYFHEYIYGQAEIRFIRGRLRFARPDGTVMDAAPFPSMVVVFHGEGGEA